MSYVQVINIDKSFQGRQVLKKIDLEIAKGEFVTLLGPSGCGKTTLLRIIAGLERSDGGKVIVNGKEILEGQSKKEQNIGMVFQSYALFPNMTAFENIAFGLKIKKVPSAEIRKQVEEVMDILSITGKENNYPHQMSGGQQQRVALARALVVRPDLLLLDEPLSAVDAKVRESARTLIRDVQKKMGITTIFVTHDQLEALVMSDRIVVIDSGEIMQYGTPEQIYHKPANKFVAQFIGTYNFIPGTLVGFPQTEVCIRPEHVLLVGKNELSQVGEADDIKLRGSLENFYILGNTVRAEVAVEGKTIVVDHLNQSARSQFALNDEVGLLIERKSCTILES
ncbi:ATP-binding cassette domain-containing protein [Desulfosporosinus sp. PR]|uniref:ABC transporter ATP-binding protein n=1 Tax=Candidatus Desulfosporosinus nitrosoreducens TaxID=3401928 RepID=UPI0027FA4BB9|nr:ATP-binding cassette domain-containing protein [Desulfosporosinus sp. PR]MDQ7093081.1 ATP-binding cassette domain-containing protein [Desulfosporosinus sp. PR]